MSCKYARSMYLYRYGAMCKLRILTARAVYEASVHKQTVDAVSMYSHVCVNVHLYVQI